MGGQNHEKTQMRKSLSLFCPVWILLIPVRRGLTWSSNQHKRKRVTSVTSPGTALSSRDGYMESRNYCGPFVRFV